MRASLVTLLIVPFAAGLPACDSDPVAPVVAEVLPVGCLGGWQPVSPPMAAALNSGLAYREGNLYIALDRGLISVAVSDGAETLLSPARADALWVEEDQLLLLGGAAGTQLLGMPLTGGTPALIADGTAGRTEVGIGQLGSHLPTATDFFFAESSRARLTDPTTVWRAPRTGGPPTEIARFTELQASGDSALHFHGVALAPEGLVLGSDWGAGRVVPVDGGSPRTLAVPAVANVVTDVDFVAADARGVYWSVRTQRTVEALAEELVISPVDGGAVRPIWSTMPALSYVVQGWPDGAGGLVLVGAQRFKDENNYRTTVWSIDATGNGNARLLACGAAGSYPYIDDMPPAIAPDAFYFVALLENSQMQFIRVPRTAP
jgi:hypothetical protein